MKRIENPKNTERGRNAIQPRREFIFPTHLFFYFPFFTQLQTAFIIGTSYAFAKLAPKRDLLILLLQDWARKYFHSIYYRICYKINFTRNAVLNIHTFQRFLFQR